MNMILVATFFISIFLIFLGYIGFLVIKKMFNSYDLDELLTIILGVAVALFIILMALSFAVMIANTLFGG